MYTGLGKMGSKHHHNELTNMQIGDKYKDQAGRIVTITSTDKTTVTFRVGKDRFKLSKAMFNRSHLKI
jgi:preprotein translocase subunit YajC